MNKDCYHFIGIGGIGMSGLAKILLEQGVSVHGSDLQSSAMVQQLIRQGAKISLGHDKENISLATKIVYSTDIAETNPEYSAAVDAKVPVLHRSDLLWEIMSKYLPLLVTGTHGKTTTSSLLTHVLCSVGKDPAFAVGGVVHSMQTNAKDGKGEYFVAEADESDGSFLKYHGHGAIITNIDLDHLNYWKTEETLIAGFFQFASHIFSPHLFWCADDARLAALHLPGVSYGYSPTADVRITSSRQEGWRLFFSLQWKESTYNDICIPLIGAHNVLNGAAVFALCIQLGLEEQKVREALRTFQGVGRRAEKKGEMRGVAFYDDYGHHPTEIDTTLKAMKEAAGQSRLVAVFQPHRYTRTRDCLATFPGCFSHADVLILTDIYSAGEKPVEGVRGDVLFEEVKKQFSKEIHFLSREHLASFVGSFLQEGDVCITIGAGDVTKIGPQVIEQWKTN